MRDFRIPNMVMRCHLTRPAMRAAILGLVAVAPLLGAQARTMRQRFPTDTTPRARMQPPSMNTVDTLFSAFGKDPYWTLAVRNDQLIVTTPHKPAGVHLPAVRADTSDRWVTWHVNGGGHALRVRSQAIRCKLAGSDDWWTDSVNVRLDGKKYKGCGGRRTRETP